VTRRLSNLRSALGLLALTSAALMSGCERPPALSGQSGYRGTGMVQIDNPRTEAKLTLANQAPPPLPSGDADGPRAKDVLKNVQVLGDLSIGQFTSQMVAITSWVSPVEGCAYCHNLANLAEDSKYTKIVARRMLQMTRHINSDWKSHVVATGVTCYTCHRGQPVPAYAWTVPVPQNLRANFIGNRNGQNEPASGTGLAALPNDPLSVYLVADTNIRVGGTVPLPASGSTAAIQTTEGTYALMVHLSNSLGVNCTFCHNSRSFASWAESPPQRAVAWHAIRMARDLNNNYLLPLGAALPPNRLGPMGDAPKVACVTCHQGVNKPLYGAPMAKDWAGLYGPAAVVPGPATEAVKVAAVNAKPVGVKAAKAK
jgi:photosynthetic reaction center cytochrome c subunit